MFRKIYNIISKSVDLLSTLLKCDRKFIKFLIVGGINTLFGYLMYSIFISVPFLSTSAALLCSYIAGVMWNFKTTGVLVFKNGDNRLMVRFFGSYVITYFINLVSLKVFEYFKVNKYLAQALLVLPVAMISFILFKKFVFASKK